MSAKDHVHSPARAAHWTAAWLGAGVAFQASFVLLPLGNYATLVYWLIYAPLLILIFSQTQLFSSAVKNSDRPLLLLIVALLVWVTLTALWPETAAGTSGLLGEAARVNLLIFLYVLGVAFLAREFPIIFNNALIAACLIIAATGVASVFTQYILNEAPLASRLKWTGAGSWTDASNPVITGIYFGAWTVFSSVLFLYNQANHWTKFALACCALACFATTLLTGTRTAVVALVITATVWLCVAGHRGWLLASGAAFLGTLLYGLHEETSWLHAYLKRGGLGSWRPQIWLSAMRESQDHIWAGSGLWHQFDLLVVRGTRHTLQPHSHNFYLQMLNWTGLVGLLLYLLTLSRAVLLSWRSLQSPLAMMGLTGMVYFLTVQVFDVHDVFTRPSYYWPCLWLPVGIILSLPSRRSSGLIETGPMLPLGAKIGG